MENSKVSAGKNGRLKHTRDTLKTVKSQGKESCTTDSRKRYMWDSGSIIHGMDVAMSLI